MNNIFLDKQNELQFLAMRAFCSEKVFFSLKSNYIPLLRLLPLEKEWTMHFKVYKLVGATP